MGENGEIIACIPVKVSAKSIFSKYTINPGSEINFGAVTVNTKKSRTFVIENKCEFDFRFTISKAQTFPNIIGKIKPGNTLFSSSSQHTTSFSDRSKVRSRRESFKGYENLCL